VQAAKQQTSLDAKENLAPRSASQNLFTLLSEVPEMEMVSAIDYLEFLFKFHQAQLQPLEVSKAMA
jgi:hypothetical protein